MPEPGELAGGQCHRSPAARSTPSAQQSGYALRIGRAQVTNALGFVKKQDFHVGAFKWLTVVSPDEPDGTELVLEPDANPASQAFK